MGNAFAPAFLSALGELQLLLPDLQGSWFVVETNMSKRVWVGVAREGRRGGRTFRVSVDPVRVKNGGNRAGEKEEGRYLTSGKN